MKIIIITFIIIAVVILGGLWYLGWLRKCYDKHQAGDSAPKLVLERIAKSHQNCKIYDERRAAVKRYMLLITFCTLILGGGAYFVDAKYEQWSADFKQWKVERAERKAQAELQKQKEERLEAERKAEEARKQQEIASLKAEQFQKLIGDAFPSAEELQTEMEKAHQNAELIKKQRNVKKQNVVSIKRPQDEEIANSKTYKDIIVLSFASLFSIFFAIFVCVITYLQEKRN